LFEHDLFGKPVSTFPDAASHGEGSHSSEGLDQITTIHGAILGGLLANSAKPSAVHATIAPVS
jgi:hypothetical protein